MSDMIFVPLFILIFFWQIANMVALYYTHKRIDIHEAWIIDNILKKNKNLKD